MGAKTQTCSRIIVLEPHEARWQTAVDLGATHVQDPGTTGNPGATAREIVLKGVNCAFDPAGIPASLTATMAAPGSKAVFGIVGGCARQNARSWRSHPISVSTVGHTIKGTIEGDSDPDSFILELIPHYQAGPLPSARLHKAFLLRRINTAIADQHSGRCIKAVRIADHVEGDAA